MSKAEFEQDSNVVDIAEAMNHIRIFREGAFDAQPVGVQAEILKARIRRVVVRENGVYVEIFGKPPELILKQLDGTAEKENPAGVSRSNLSDFRTGSKLAPGRIVLRSVASSSLPADRRLGRSPAHPALAPCLRSS